MRLNKPYRHAGLEAKRRAALAAIKAAKEAAEAKVEIRKTRDVIQEIYNLCKNNKLDVPGMYRYPSLNRTIANAFSHLPAGRADYLYRLFQAILDQTDLLPAKLQNNVVAEFAAEDVITSLCQMVHWKDYWLKEPEQWKCKTYNAERQIFSLANWLFAKYRVPAFMERIWLDDLPNARSRALKQEWYIHIGRGQNIRTANDLPIKLTKMMAHCFLQAPAESTIDQAFRYAQVMGMGGTERLAKGIFQSRLANEFTNDEFWSGVILFFVNNPMIDMNQVAPIIDYIHNQKFVDRHEIIDGETINHGPRQPNFNLKGRTVLSLMKQMEEWHKEMAVVNRQAARNRVVNYWKAVETTWPTSRIKSFDASEGTKGNTKLYRIVELTSTSALVEEGRALGHCVASYWTSCKNGKDAIFSLMKKFPDSPWERQQTIQINLSNLQITQCRGRFNSQPDAVSSRIIRNWATREGLSIGGYVGI